MHRRLVLHTVFATGLLLLVLQVLFGGLLKAWMNDWPTNLEAAADRVLQGLTVEQKAQLASTPRERLALYHFNLGMEIRNSMGLWRGNDPLLSAACEGHSSCHPDDASMKIIEVMWDKLQHAAPDGSPARTTWQ